MSSYREQLQVSIVFPGNKFLSFLDAKVTTQLNSDDLRNVGQTLASTIPSTSSKPIKHFRPDPGLERLLPKRISRIGVAERGRAFRR